MCGKKFRCPDIYGLYGSLTHLSLVSHKRDIGKQCRPRSDAAERGVWSESTLFALTSEISTTHDNSKNWPDTLCIKNGPVQRVKIEEFTQHKWVKGNAYIFREDNSDKIVT